jgi:TrmH family RNA methyltransferase
MGAVLRLPLRQAAWPVIAEAVRGLDIWLAAASGGAAYTRVDWRRPAALLIGSEASGAGPEAEALATGRVTIPMRDETESLNAAVAAGILLFEAARQREEADERPGGRVSQ